MTNREYLLIKVMQEAAELSQAASKIMEYGEGGVNPKDPAHVNNITSFIEEGVQVLAAIKNYLDHIKGVESFERIQLSEETLDTMLEEATDRQIWLGRVLKTNQVITE